MKSKATTWSLTAQSNSQRLESIDFHLTKYSWFTKMFSSLYIITISPQRFIKVKSYCSKILVFQGRIFIPNFFVNPLLILTLRLFAHLYNLYHYMILWSLLMIITSTFNWKHSPWTRYFDFFVEKIKFSVVENLSNKHLSSRCKYILR